MSNIVKSYKSTLLGLCLIIFSSVLIYQNISHDYFINGVLYFIGLGLFFTGDSFINKIQNLVLRYFNNNYIKKDNSND